MRLVTVFNPKCGLGSVGDGLLLSVQTDMTARTFCKSYLGETIFKVGNHVIGRLFPEYSWKDAPNTVKLFFLFETLLPHPPDAAIEISIKLLNWNEHKKPDIIVYGVRAPTKKRKKKTFFVNKKKTRRLELRCCC